MIDRVKRIELMVAAGAPATLYVEGCNDPIPIKLTSRGHMADPEQHTPPLTQDADTVRWAVYIGEEPVRVGIATGSFYKGGTVRIDFDDGVLT